MKAVLFSALTALVLGTTGCASMGSHSMQGCGCACSGGAKAEATTTKANADTKPEHKECGGCGADGCKLKTKG